MTRFAGLAGSALPYDDDTMWSLGAGFCDQTARERPRRHLAWRDGVALGLALLALPSAITMRLGSAA